MSRNVRVLHCTPEDVFEVLSDGWLYPSWVVGASRMREVHETWPMPGAELHHSFGMWPVLLDDKTIVEEFVPSRMMVMRARGWPIGEARVTIDVKPRGDECVVRIQEEAIAGPGRLVPQQLLDLPLHWRNAETLHRLAYLAEGRAVSRTHASTAEKEMAMTGEQSHGADGVDADRPATAAGTTGVADDDELAAEAGGSTGATSAEDAWNPLSRSEAVGPAAQRAGGPESAEAESP